MAETRDRTADLDKLATAFIENLEREDRCEYGGWGLDDKRPFGNSSVAHDILEIIGWEPELTVDRYPAYTDEQKDYAHALYDDLGDHVKRRWREMLRHKTLDELTAQAQELGMGY